MYRSFALLALPLLVAGCGSSSTSQSARSAPPPTIDSFRTSYFGQQPSAAGLQPSAPSQIAAIPQPVSAASPAEAAHVDKPPADQSSALPQPLDAPDASSDAGPVASQVAAAPPKPAGPPPYKVSVAAYIKRYAVDGSSLKLAKIGTPFQGSVNGQKGSVVCVELGGLSTNRTAYLLKDNSVADSEFGAVACRDKKLAPWDNPGA